MHKIKNKLIFAFGTSIAVLFLVMALNLNYTKKSRSTNKILNEHIEPAVRLLDHYQVLNNELFLLSLNKVAARQNVKNTNRMKIITEVELPHLRNEAASLIARLPKEDSKIGPIKEIIDQTDHSIDIVKYVYSLLPTKTDYQDPINLNKATKTINQELSGVSMKIEHAIASLQLEFNKENEIHQSDLTQQLENVSTIIFITSNLAILIGLIVAFTAINSIVKPIEILEVGSRRISAGDLGFRVDLKGKDELAMLGNSFNEMAASLDKSFKSINAKNRELEQFVYIASHDLQEPLRTLTNFTGLLSSQYKERVDADGKQYIHFISEASTRMRDLVKGLMDHSRIGHKNDFENLECTTLVRHVCEDLAAVIQDAEAHLEIDTLPQIMAYKTQIRLLFQNLISNAIKFRKPNIRPQIHIYEEQDDNFWKIAIKDNGIGIAAKDQNKIFSIFQRLHVRSSYEGTGIGLAHCTKIIELHGGKIWVDSQPNIGSTFYFTIPKSFCPVPVSSH